MNKKLYVRLAINNIKKNSKTYIPYIITCVGTIMMFYMMLFIASNDALDSISGSEALKSILFFGIWIIGIFSAVFLFYTNSFLIKRRKKEFGLYNILGMEKKHISKMLCLESIIIFFISIILGFICGILFSKLIFLLLLKLLNFDISISFYVSTNSIILTAIVFGAIFILTLLYDILQIKTSKPIELLYGDKCGEKEPKTKWIIAIIGIICLVAGYVIALTIKTPLSALQFFFVAVILVMIGTYCLFTAGSIAILKTLRKNKKYYYKTKHFCSVSGMIYRMKQNAVGLANICILSTAVILVLAATTCLYVGIGDVLNTIYPREVQMSNTEISDASNEQFNAVYQETKKQCNFDTEDEIEYRYGEAILDQQGNEFTTSTDSAYGGMSDSNMFIFIPLDDYNRCTGENQTLAYNEIFIFDQTNKEKPVTFENNISINGQSFNIKNNNDSINLESRDTMFCKQTYAVVCNDIGTIESLTENTLEITGNPTQICNYMGFNTNDDENISTFIDTLQNNLTSKQMSPYYVEVKSENVQYAYSLYGCLFFVGIFLGILFLMVTVLIIYYKQISEGYEDRERFQIMQKVGMSQTEVKKTIKTQILMVFFIPLVVAIIHTSVVFPMLTKILKTLNLTNVPLFALCTVITIIIFCILYSVVYSLTARVYYKIIQK